MTALSRTLTTMRNCDTLLQMFCCQTHSKSAFGAKKIAILCCMLSLSHTLMTATAFRNLFLVFFFPNAKLKKINKFSFLG